MRGDIHLRFKTVTVSVLFFSLYILASCSVHDLSNTGLLAVPDSIPPGTTELRLYENFIYQAVKFPQALILEKLYFGHNRLRQFPNITRYGLKLKDLFLDNNIISHINVEFLDALTALETLDLEGNRLKATDIPPTTNVMSLTTLVLTGNPLGSVPLFGTLAKNVTFLYIANTNITEIKDDDFAEFQAAPVLQMQDVSITDLGPKALVPIGSPFINKFDLKASPNFCRASSSSIFLWMGMTIPCDCHAIWGRISPHWSVMSPICSSPGNLLGLPANIVPLNDFKCDGFSRSHEVTPINPAEFYCSAPPLRHEYDVISFAECADRCANLEGCLMFQVTEVPGGMTCRLTDISDSVTSGGDLNVGKWFTLD